MPQDPEQRIAHLYAVYHLVQNTPEGEEVLEELDERIEDLAEQRRIDPDQLRTQINQRYWIDL